MTAVVSPADATIIVALIMAIIGPIATIAYQHRVHRDNRVDHAETAVKVDALLATTGELAADVRDTKADVRDIKSTLRHHSARLDNLEAHHVA